MKNLIEEIDSRIKSPLFGFFIFSALAFNWAPLFYLVIHDGSASDRITYFNNHTDSWSLFIWPILFAIIYSALYPWLQYVFIFLGRKPTELQDSLQAQSEHNLLIKKQKLEKARSNILAETEKELIERAKRDVALEDIEDGSVREQLQSEIEGLRKEREDLRGSLDQKVEANTSSLTKEHEEIIRLITTKGGSMYIGEIIKASSFNKVKTEYYIEDLLENKYLRKDLSLNGNHNYFLTTKSKKIMVDKGVAQ